MKGLRWQVVGAGVIALVGHVAVSAGQAVGSKTTLRVEIVGFRNSNGTARVALWQTQDGFPEDPEKAQHKYVVPIVGGRATVVVEGLDPGPWAIAAFHDENGNGKLDKGLMGIPKEGVGISRNARGRFGPPSFDQARLDLSPGARDVTFRIIYY